MPEDTQSTISHRSARSARSQTGSVRSVLTTLSKKGPFHRRTTVGDDDPLETLSMADYQPPTATDEEAMAIRAAMNMNNPGGWGVPASVTAKWDNVMDKMPRIKLPERAKADTVEDVKRRQTEEEEKQHEFQMFVEEQRMLGREINPNYYEYLNEEMQQSAELERQLGIAPPRQRPQGPHGYRGGPPPQPGRPGPPQQTGFLSRILGPPRRNAAPRRPMTLAEAEAMALSGTSRPQEQEYGSPQRQKQPRPVIRRLHEEEAHSREAHGRRDEYDGGYDYEYEAQPSRRPPQAGPPARRNSSARTPAHYEDQYDQSYEYESYAKPPPRRGGSAQRSRSQEYARGGEYEYEYDGGYGGEYGHPKYTTGHDMHSQNAGGRRGGYGQSHEYSNDYSNDHYARQQPQRRPAAGGPPARRGGGEYYDEYSAGGYGGSYGGQYW